MVNIVLLIGWPTWYSNLYKKTFYFSRNLRFCKQVFTWRVHNKTKTFYLTRNLLFCKQEVTSPINLKLFNTLFNFLFEGNEKIAWNMNFVFIKAKIMLSFLFFLTLIETKFMFQAIFSLPSNRKLNNVWNNFSLISEFFFCQTRRTHQNRNEHDSCKSEPLCNSPILEGSKITNEELMDTSVSHRWPQVWVFWSC